LHNALQHLEMTVQPLVEKVSGVNDILKEVPDVFRVIGRAGGIYGDFFNFYLCDAALLVNGLQPGGPVRTVKLVGQPTGRCTPQ
jgi:phospholipid/cholesterol/gamma-HCH transport system substrate-binding protein